MFRSRSATDQLLPYHLLAAAAQLRPSIIVAPRGKEQLLALRMTSRLLGLWGYVCVCRCVKGQGVLWISTLFERVCGCVNWFVVVFRNRRQYKEEGFSQWLLEYSRCSLKYFNGKQMMCQSLLMNRKCCTVVYGSSCEISHDASPVSKLM